MVGFRPYDHMTHMKSRWRDPRGSANKKRLTSGSFLLCLVTTKAKPHFFNGRSPGSNLWRYVSTICLAIWIVGISPYIGLKNRPYMGGTSNQSVPVAWPLIYVGILAPHNYDEIPDAQPMVLEYFYTYKTVPYFGGDFFGKFAWSIWEYGEIY